MQQDLFYGYKNHLAINNVRFITAMHSTLGNYSDGNNLSYLTMNSINNVAIPELIIADRAFSTKRNIEFCNNVNLDLVNILNPTITTTRNLESDGVH